MQFREAEQAPARVSRLVIEWSQTGVRQNLTPGWRFWLTIVLGLLGIAATAFFGLLF